MKFRLIILLLLSCLGNLVYAQDTTQTTYPLAVKFISIGTGVPDNKPVMDFIAAFKKKNKIREIKIDRIGPLGKEGEYDLALRLTELTKQQKKLFIQQIKKVDKKTGDRGHIHYEENVSYDKSKQPVHGKLQTIKIE